MRRSLLAGALCLASVSPASAGLIGPIFVNFGVPVVGGQLVEVVKEVLDGQFG